MIEKLKKPDVNLYFDDLSQVMKDQNQKGFIMGGYNQIKIDTKNDGETLVIKQGSRFEANGELYFVGEEDFELDIPLAENTEFLEPFFEWHGFLYLIDENLELSDAEPEFNPVLSGHYIGLPLIFLLILSFGISAVYLHLKKSLVVLVVVVVLFACSINQLKLFNTFQKSDWIGDSSVYRNQTQIIDYIYKEAGGNKFNYLVYTPPIFDYPYQYLFKWYAVKKYGHSPEKSVQKLLFVVLEPDTMPDRQKAWLDVRKGDGKVVKEKVFDSGIIVQTRTR